jgi:hypothetical protein
MSLLVGLVSGNLWVYPESISQGWDASLAHTPYHSLRNEAIDSLEVLNIDVSEIASFFPNYNKIDEIDLNENPKAFTKFSNNSKYVFYSNIYNLSDEDYQILANQYSSIMYLKRHRIFVSILKKD